MTITARDYTFAEWLERLLEAQNIKAIHFAKISEISRSSISRYLSGERVPKAAKQEQLVKAICKITDMQMAEIAHKVLWHCYISERRRQQ